LGIKVVSLRVLDKKLVSGADIFESARPGTAFISDPSIFEVRRSYPLCGESSAKVSGMIETVFRAPESAMDINQERVGPSLNCGQPKVDELIWVRAVR
jgi:hypothetical protein